MCFDIDPRSILIRMNYFVNVFLSHRLFTYNYYSILSLKVNLIRKKYNFQIRLKQNITKIWLNSHEFRRDTSVIMYALAASVVVPNTHLHCIQKNNPLRRASLSSRIDNSMKRLGTPTFFSSLIACSENRVGLFTQKPFI